MKQMVKLEVDSGDWLHLQKENTEFYTPYIFIEKFCIEGQYNEIKL